MMLSYDEEQVFLDGGLEHFVVGAYDGADEAERCATGVFVRVFAREQVVHTAHQRLDAVLGGGGGT